MPHIIPTLILLYFSCVVNANANASDKEFVAAVYEHPFKRLTNRTNIPTREEALGLVMENMDVYKEQILKAKAKNASIIVFPEYGLTGFGHTRESFEPFLEDIPDPTKTEWYACSNPKPDNSTAILTRLSCLAKDNSMYAVVNMGDIKKCNRTRDKHCPDDGRYQYNTNVVFDKQGKLIARYHKQHPFLNEMKVINRPLEPEFVTFETPFGKFGTFTCFDVLFHDPAVPLVTKYNIDHVIFPTAWFDVLPLFAAIGFHSSWARGMGVNYLASNTHVPQLRNTGSGIYSPMEAKKFYRSFSSQGSLLVATLPISPRNISRTSLQANATKTSNGFLGNTENSAQDKSSFFSDVFGDLFLFKELKNQEDVLNICYNKTSACCSLTYKMEEKRLDELYALGVFYGVHTKEGLYKLSICTLIKCQNLSRETCGQSVNDASTIFESFTLRSKLNASYVYPQVIGDGVTLLPDQWNHDFPVTTLQTNKKLSKGLLTAALFGRVYNMNPSALPPSTAFFTANIPSHKDPTSKIPSSPARSCYTFSSLICFCLVLLQELWNT